MPAPRLNADIDAAFERVKASPPALRAFLQAMPKGADLHSHLSGAVYTESYLRWAVQAGLCVDAGKLVLLDCAAAPDLEPVAGHYADMLSRNRLIDALSTRNYHLYGRSGHDQFFATFSAIGPAGRDRVPDMLAEVLRRAGEQNILYLELMASPGMASAAALAAEVPWNDDLATMRAALDDAALDGIVAGVAGYVRGLVADARERLDCAGPASRAGCGVAVRFLAQVIRTRSAPEVFAQLVYGFRLARAVPEVVGINLVAPEDDPVALADYTRHMRAVAFASEEAPEAGIALHAGELTLGLVPPKHLRFHIREAVAIAGAQRIGHGVDVMFEDDPYALLDMLRERNVLVEVNLTSNDVILGVAGDDHPLPIYLAAGVPVTLSTDDEGVSRIDLTNEYQRAVLTYDLSYADIKAFSVSGIDYGFLPPAQKAALRADLEARFRAFEARVMPGGELR